MISVINHNNSCSTLVKYIEENRNTIQDSHWVLTEVKKKNSIKYFSGPRYWIYLSLIFNARSQNSTVKWLATGWRLGRIFLFTATKPSVLCVIHALFLAVEGKPDRAWNWSLISIYCWLRICTILALLPLYTLWHCA